jgi:hypothetical protein
VTSGFAVAFQDAVGGRFFRRYRLASDRGGSRSEAICGHVFHLK